MSETKRSLAQHHSVDSVESNTGVEKVCAPAESLREVIEVADSSVSHYEKEGLQQEAHALDEALSDLIGVVTESPQKAGEFVSVPARSLETVVAASGWTNYHKGLQNILEAYGVWG